MLTTKKYEDCKMVEQTETYRLSLKRKMEKIVNYIKDVIEIIRDIIGEIFYI